MIVLDASVLIGHLEAGDEHHAEAGRVLVAAVRAREDLTVSPVTEVEALVGAVRAGQLSRAEAALDQLGVTTTALPDDAPSRLARLRVETGLRLPDCCVLLVAEQTGATLATFDGRLARAAAARGTPVAGG